MTTHVPDPLFELSIWAFWFLRYRAMLKRRSAMRVGSVDELDRGQLTVLITKLVDLEALLDPRPQCWIDRMVLREIEKTIDACQLLIRLRVVTTGVLPSGGFVAPIIFSGPPHQGPSGPPT